MIQVALALVALALLRLATPRFVRASKARSARRQYEANRVAAFVGPREAGWSASDELTLHRGVVIGAYEEGNLPRLLRLLPPEARAKADAAGVATYGAEQYEEFLRDEGLELP
jgi:hypothetical protein